MKLKLKLKFKNYFLLLFKFLFICFMQNVLFSGNNILWKNAAWQKSVVKRKEVVLEKKLWFLIWNVGKNRQDHSIFRIFSREFPCIINFFQKWQLAVLKENPSIIITVFSNLRRPNPVSKQIDSNSIISLFIYNFCAEIKKSQNSHNHCFFMSLGCLRKITEHFSNESLQRGSQTWIPRRSQTREPIIR